MPSSSAPAHYPGYPAVERKGTDIATHPFARGPRDPSVRGLRHDIALLRLAEPVPPDVAEPMAVAPMAVLDRPPVVAAFRGNSTVRARQRSCPILERRGEMLILSCAVRKGESGAPVIAVTGDDLAVVAVVSAQSKVMRTEVALAVVAAGAGPCRASPLSRRVLNAVRDASQIRLRRMPKKGPVAEPPG